MNKPALINGYKVIICFYTGQLSRNTSTHSLAQLVELSRSGSVDDFTLLISDII